MSEGVSPSPRGTRPGFAVHTHNLIGGLTVAVVALLMLGYAFYVPNAVIPRLMSAALVLIGIVTAEGTQAIGALLVAMYSGWVWADPAVGLIGSAVIASWAFGLVKSSGAVLLDVRADEKLERTIRMRMEVGDDRVTDLHLWQVGPGHCAAVISLVSEAPLLPATYKERLRDLKGLSHVTVEVERCPH